MVGRRVFGKNKGGGDRRVVSPIGYLNLQSGEHFIHTKDTTTHNEGRSVISQYTGDSLYDWVLGLGIFSCYSPYPRNKSKDSNVRFLLVIIIIILKPLF